MIGEGCSPPASCLGEFHHAFFPISRLPLFAPSRRKTRNEGTGREPSGSGPRTTIRELTLVDNRSWAAGDCRIRAVAQWESTWQRRLAWVNPRSGGRRFKSSQSYFVSLEMGKAGEVQRSNTLFSLGRSEVQILSPAPVFRDHELAARRKTSAPPQPANPLAGCCGRWTPQPNARIGGVHRSFRESNSRWHRWPWRLVLAQKRPTIRPPLSVDVTCVSERTSEDRG